MVGAPGPNQAAYVFEKPAAGWGTAGTAQTETAKLTPADGGPLGISVAINGDTIAAREGNDTVGTNVSQGSVCVFVQPAAGWQSGHETAKLIASDGAAGYFLGYLVAVNSDAVIALAGSQNGVETSAAYAFAKPAAGWSGTVNECRQGGGLGPIRRLQWPRAGRRNKRRRCACRQTDGLWRKTQARCFCELVERKRRQPLRSLMWHQAGDLQSGRWVITDVQSLDAALQKPKLPL
jgi:hypothetical protein